MSMCKRVGTVVLGSLIVGVVLHDTNFKAAMVPCKQQGIMECPLAGDPRCGHNCNVNWDTAYCAGCVDGTQIRFYDPEYKCLCAWTERHRSYQWWFNWDDHKTAHISVTGCYGTCPPSN
jgi:hypothetical protein